jgi:hypothetical protein
MNGTVSIPIPNEYGRFENLLGYACTKVADKRWGLVWDKSIYRAVMNAVNPLTFRDVEGILYRTGASFLTDLGSIPVCWQGLPHLSKDQWLLGYLFHDFGCGAGGMYQSFDSGKTWIFVKMNREQCDNMLYVMVGALGGGWLSRHAVWCGVRAGARFQDHPSGFFMMDNNGIISPFTDYCIPAMIDSLR